MTLLEAIQGCVKALEDISKMACDCPTVFHRESCPMTVAHNALADLRNAKPLTTDTNLAADLAIAFMDEHNDLDGGRACLRLLDAKLPRPR